MEKLFLIDAYALIFKFYYAFINRPMRNSEGLNTSAIYGFTKFINDIITREKPHHLGVAFDPKGGNFRHQLFPQYKANRSATPEDIILSTPHIKRILEAMCIPVLEVAGYEADDVIGTISNKAACHGFEVFMVTPDKDYGQLIRDCVYMYKPARSGDGIEIVGKDRIKEIYGIDDPKKIIDILALWGDASDNIPGVPGVGEKTAIKLINEYGSIDEILASVDTIKGKIKDNIIANTEQLLLSRTLATIDLDVPIAFEPDKLLMCSPKYDELRKIYIEMGFRSLLKDLDFWQKADCVEEFVPHNESGQLSLFDMEPAKAVLAKTDKGVTSIINDAAASLFDAAVEFENIESVTHNYQIITGDLELSQLIGVIKMKGEVAFDTETTSLNAHEALLVGLSLALEPHKAYYIPLFPHDKLKTMVVLEKLRPIFESSSIVKVGQNVKYDILVLKNYGISVNGFLYDTMIMDYLLDSDTGHSMDYMAQKYLNYQPVPIESLIGKGSSQITMDLVDTQIVGAYAAEDADITLQLKNYLLPKLNSESMMELYRTIDEPLIKVLADMEAVGVKIDIAMLKEYEGELITELDGLDAKIRELSGEREVNINSPKQLGEVLFEKLKITDKPLRTKTKQYRTDEEYLTSLEDRHPIIGAILEYRGVKKLLSTYVQALPLLVDSTDDRLHTTYNQALVSTGRLSSTNPNLQNIPIRDERAQRIRKAFVASDSDHLLLSADYSQVELRVMAHLSGDESLIEAFRQGEDIHTATAAKIFDVTLEEVTKEQRRQAKTANFGIIYGISVFGLSQRLDISRADSKNIIESYFASYPKVKEYMDLAIVKARESGYAETIYGRRRELKDIRSSNAVVRSYAERNAINAPIQGSAADIIKLAMKVVADRIKETGVRCRPILQVHDELIFELHKDDLEQVKVIVTESMEQAAELSVPLTVDLGYGSNWYDAH